MPTKSNEPEFRRGYTADLKLLGHAKERYGLSYQDFVTKARLATKATSPYGNRRYEEWYFTLEGTSITGYYFAGSTGMAGGARLVEGVLQEVAGVPSGTRDQAGSGPHVVTREELFGGRVFQPTTPKTKYYACEFCKDTGRVTVYEECMHCEGEGCAQCNHTGEATREIPCQDCHTPLKKRG